ncbi:thiolase family protein [Scleromatobacter humisilvae]|uniref:propanoyl-CoA C-acyltransferase n=1 Tax=Scleromatobacter humisilvae TaxID=2897159 RepID=A0A9X1YJU5_9BURK|nr:thiolase family protein [Scleromatobacter humisilvae]MCK9685687.1 thiolase family protein [Scleromatobacter humisilvae]
MTDVYVVGIDMLKFGRYPDRTVVQLAAQAAIGALDDCKLGMRDVQALYSGNIGETMTGQRTLQLIGQTGIPVVNCTNACATGATALREGWTAIKAGLYDTVLCIGVEKMAAGMIVKKKVGNEPLPAEGLIGSETMPAVFAMVGMEHMRTYGTTLEQFAQVSVKNHHHSTLNPKAMYQKETPLEEVMGSEMIAYPNTKLMCSVNVDGAAAAVLMSEKKARELGLMSRAVRVRASALASDPFTERNLVMQDVNAVTRLAAETAYAMAGLGPKDIDLVELHDCFATAEILHYENLGLCADGEGGRLIDSRDTALGGRIPVNVSGGLLSKGHPLGATGIANVYEIATHLRGEAGARQVQGARIGMTHVVGLGSACAVHILEKA